MRLSPSRLIDRALAPAPAPARVAALAATPYAHRGLHNGRRVENSRAAFEAAIAKGHGFELDVQLSRDGVAMVFHDEQLDRLTKEKGPIGLRASSELQLIRLRGSKETIPPLAEIVQLNHERVPMLVEIKARSRRVGALCLAVHRALDGYRGNVGVMSFNPDVGLWFARHARNTLRGLVVTESERRGARGSVERSLALWRAKPDFLAYDVRDLPSRFAARARARGLPVLTWTVRSDADRTAAGLHADQIIYEA